MQQFRTSFILLLPGGERDSTMIDFAALSMQPGCKLCKRIVRDQAAIIKTRSEPDDEDRTVMRAQA